VVRHQAERVDVPSEAARSECQKREERTPVVVAADDRDLPCATGDDVKDAALGLGCSRKAGHDCSR
jgi:hypothetical protein